MQSRIVFLTLAFSALLLAACKFHATTTIRPDGAGELRREVGFSAEERQNLEEQGGSNTSQDFCNTAASQDARGLTVIEEQRGDETWCININTYGNIDVLRSLYEERRGLRINRLEISGDHFYYDVDIDTLADTSDFSAFTEITWSVVLPGTPVYHNAAQADGNTLIWNVEPRSGMVNLRAESRVEQSILGLPMAIIAAGFLSLCGISLVGGVWGVFLLRRSNRRARVRLR